MRYKISNIELLQQMLKVLPPDDSCLEWPRSCDGQGYGMLSVGHVTVRAHRMAFQIANGSIDENLYVCHKCDNPPCFRPDHLFVGTNSDNIRDCFSKGRSRIAKITMEQAREIRGLRGYGIGLKDIAMRYSLDRSTVAKICRGERWK